MFIICLAVFEAHGSKLDIILNVVDVCRLTAGRLLVPPMIEHLK